jgi:hypothetical protein
MLPENNKILDQSLLDDLSNQLYNITKIFHVMKDDEEKKKLISQLVKDFLKQYIKNKDHVNIEKSAGD